MRVLDRPSVALAFWAVAVEAVDYKRYDGVHRVEKRAPRPQITKSPMLERRNEVCGTSSKLCPSSLDGGCCPDGYDCATDSCYATTKGPSTCGTRVGWYNCNIVYGNGCCPDGYICETAGNCIPPSGSAYTFGCPTSYHLCASSFNYGCCRNGMACATNQCYSTNPVTSTQTVTITTTEDGSWTTYRTTRVTVSTPDEPTDNIVNSDDGNDQAIIKYYPAAVTKKSPTSDTNDDGGGGGALSTQVVVGIVVGVVAFLIIVLVAAFIIIRRLNKVVAAVTTSKQSDNSKNRPNMKSLNPSESGIDAQSADPFMPLRPSAPAPDSSHHTPYNLASPDLSSNDHTPSASVAGYHAVDSNGNSRHTSFDANNEDYFPNTGNRASRHSGVSAPTSHRVSNDSHGAYTHVRNWSNGSDSSDGGVPMWNQLTIAELEAQPRVPELPLSPSNGVFARDERRRSSGGTASTARPPATNSRQRNRSESLGQSALGVVDEEMHGFHGPPNHLVGQTETHRPGTKEGNGEGSST